MIIISLLGDKFHLINALVEIIRYMKHSNPSEVHEEPNMIGIESRKPSLTGEVFHDDFHHGDISVKEVGERKNHLLLILVPWFKIWLIIIMIQISLFKPSFPNIWDPSSSCYNVSGHSEIDPGKSDLFIMKVRNEQSCQHRMVLDSLHFFTKLETAYVLKACHNEGRYHKLFGICWFMSDDFPSLLIWLSLLSFFLTRTYVILFSHLLVSKTLGMMELNGGI